jgi:hypothetical protein
MSNFSKSISKFVTCEVRINGKVSCFAKLNNGSWTAVKENGGLDWVEINSTDFANMLEAVESVGADIRFTNHSAA